MGVRLYGQAGWCKCALIDRQRWRARFERRALAANRLTDKRGKGFWKDCNLEYWISPRKSKLEAIDVMLWHRRHLNLSTVVLPIGHAFSWLISRKNELEVEKGSNDKRL